MMGRREAGQGQFFYSFDLNEVVPADHLVRQRVARSELGAQGVGTLLLAHGTALDRPGANDADAPCRLCVCDPLRATDLR
jgi:hypothetical protein